MPLRENSGPVMLIRKALTRMGALAAHPLAFVAVALYGVLWALSEEPMGWHGFATLATWFVALFIQRTEHRDTQALHAKLDELLHAQAQARSALTRIDDEEPEVIERHRDDARRYD